MLYPRFYRTEEFADMTGLTVGHVTAACKNHVDHKGRPMGNRARLPEGWDVIRWGRVYVIFAIHDRPTIDVMFRVER